MSDFKTKVTAVNEVVIIETEGYLNNEGGQMVYDICMEKMASGSRKFLLNLSGTKVVNSIGVSIIIEVIEKLQELDCKSIYILETCAASGTELLSDLKDFGDFYHRFSETQKKNLKICIDTCHVFSAGYSLKSEEDSEEALAEGISRDRNGAGPFGPGAAVPGRDHSGARVSPRT
jgi:hypothetical protein